MKNYLLQIITIFTVISSSCHSQDKNTIIEIEYFASTRGSSIRIVLSPNHIIYNDSISEISLKTWNAITFQINELNLNKISQLPAPSEDRFRDAALAAEIRIRTSKTIYNSSQFDHGNPPKEIKTLVQQILLLVEK